MVPIELHHTETFTEVVFERNAKVQAGLKAAIPSARWNPKRRRWVVLGVRARSRTEAWLAALRATEPTPEQVAALRAGLDANPIGSRWIRKDAAGLIISTPFSEGLAAMIRALPGAAWHRDPAATFGGAWRVPYGSVEALRTAAPGITKMADALLAQMMAEREQRAREIEQQRAAREAERQATAAAAQAAAPKRMLVLLSENLPLGRPLRLRGKLVVIESIGARFRVDEDMLSIFGSWLLGECGAACANATVRDPTDVERAALEAEEAAEAAARDKRLGDALLRRTVRRALAAEGVRPAATDPAPTGGKTLHHYRAHTAIYGGGERVMLAKDGALWLVRGNGGDGDDWSQNDQSGGIGYRLPAGPRADELVALLPADDGED